MDPSRANDVDHVAEWIALMKSGHNEAAARLWRHYLARARAVFTPLPRREAQRRPAGVSDVVQSAFWSVVNGARAGAFPELDGPDELWKILSSVARRKAAQICRKENLARRARRKVGKTVEVADALSPADQAAGSDRREYLLQRRADDGHREIAKRREEGYTNEEIAALLGTSVRNVERALNRIRKRLQRHNETGEGRRDGPA